MTMCKLWHSVITSWRNVERNICRGSPRLPASTLDNGLGRLAVPGVESENTTASRSSMEMVTNARTLNPVDLRHQRPPSFHESSGSGGCSSWPTKARCLSRHFLREKIGHQGSCFRLHFHTTYTSNYNQALLILKFTIFCFFCKL